MNRLLDRLSARERRLALITMTIVIVSATILGGRSALTRMDAQRHRIDQLEQHLINLTEQSARRQKVEWAYHSVALQHSSEWTEQEIHDRLRREIYRLALIGPYSENSEAPESITEKDYLVKIPVLREGILNEEHEGYREYQIRIQSRPTALRFLITFLERLEKSHQSLRIDELELTREPMGRWIGMTVIVTRIVVDNISEDEAGADAVPS